MPKDFNIDKDLYIKWRDEKTKTLDAMTIEEIEARIIEVGTIEFYAKSEGMLLFQQLDKLTGRKGIPDWIRADRDKLITEPNIKVNWDGEPRKKEKKEKKPKEDKVMNLLGFDMKAAMRQLKAESDNNKASEEADRREAEEDKKPLNMNDALAFLTSSQPVEPVEEKPKATEEEIKAKADALKERMKARLIKTS